MIHIYGDSHADFCFRNLQNEHHNHFIRSITMHRIGRDKKITYNFANNNVQNGDTIIFQVGEVDCRCHIHRQLEANRQLDMIMDELVIQFIDSININAINYENLHIIICCIPPPICKDYYESLHGPVTHEFPFLGTDEMRAFYTMNMNKLLREKCNDNNWIFLDYYDKYKNDKNLLRIELSDDICHIKENQMILDMLGDILYTDEHLHR